MGINLGGNFGMSNNDSMPVLNLQKNDILDLTKKNPGLKKVILGAGWDISRNGADFDLDIAAFLLDSNNKFNTVSNVIFFNNPKGQGITLSGDNRTGAGDGADLHPVRLSAGTAFGRCPHRYPAPRHPPQQNRESDLRLDRQHWPLRALYHPDGGHHALHQAGSGHQNRRQGRHRAPGGLRRPLHRPHGGNLSGRGRRRRGGGRSVHGRIHSPDRLEGLFAGGKALPGAGRCHFRHHHPGLHRDCRRCRCWRSGRYRRAVRSPAVHHLGDVGNGGHPDHHGADCPVPVRLAVQEDRQTAGYRCR